VCEQTNKNHSLDLVYYADDATVVLPPPFPTLPPAVAGKFRGFIDSAVAGRTDVPRGLDPLPERHQDILARHRHQTKVLLGIPSPSVDSSDGWYPATMKVKRIQEEVRRFGYLPPPSLTPATTTLARAPRVPRETGNLKQFMTRMGLTTLRSRLHVAEYCCGGGFFAEAIRLIWFADVVIAFDFIPGCDQPVRQQKHKVKFGNLEEPIRTYRAAHPHLCFNQDVTRIHEVNARLDAAEAASGQPIRMAIGSPPCQQFSGMTAGLPNTLEVAGVTPVLARHWVDRRSIHYILLENVTRMTDIVRKGPRAGLPLFPEWAVTKAILEESYVLAIMILESSRMPPMPGCRRSPQGRSRCYTFGIRRHLIYAQSLCAALRAAALLLVDLPPYTLEEEFPELAGHAYLATGRSMRIRTDANQHHGTLTCNCNVVPKNLDPWRLAARDLGMTWDDVRIFDMDHYLRIQGVRPDYPVPDNRHSAGTIIGNGVSPCCPFWIITFLDDAGAFHDLAASTPECIPLLEPTWAWEDGAGVGHGGVAPPAAYSAAVKRCQQQNQAVWDRIRPFRPTAAQRLSGDHPGTRRAALTCVQRYHLDAGRETWALDRPRWAQHPRMRRWRAQQTQLGLPFPSAMEEFRTGLGRRNVTIRQEDTSGNRALLIDTDDVVRNTCERWINEDGFYDERLSVSGICGPIAHRFGACTGDWIASGMPLHMADKICGRHADAPWTWTLPATPIGAGMPSGERNSSTTRDPRWQTWLFQTVTELCVLGAAQENVHRPFQVAPLSMTSKSNYDPVLRPNRLRLVYDAREQNKQLHIPKFRLERLDDARDVIDAVGNITEDEREEGFIFTDMSNGFWHVSEAPDAAATSGFALGNRSFNMVSAPQGKAPVPHWFQKIMWVLSKRFRRFGIRLICYLDDFVFFVKRRYAVLAATFIRGELRRHGVYINEKKSGWKWSRTVICLGVEINLDLGKFFCPVKKRDKLLVKIHHLTEMHRLKRQIWLKDLASVVGSIMALRLSHGNRVRVMTRAAYSYITLLTGVPPDTPVRALKAAWNCWGSITPRVLRELNYWNTAIRRNRGQYIHQPHPRPVLTVGSDAGEHMWGGTLNDGKGNKYLAQGHLPAYAIGESSTLREVVAHMYMLQSFEQKIVHILLQLDAAIDHWGQLLTCRELDARLDSQSATGILDVGSPVEMIQDVVVEIFLKMEHHSIIRHNRWNSRNTDIMALNDDLSKYIDNSDYQLDPTVFRFLERWGGAPYTIDRFASSDNKLCNLFNSKFFSPGCEAPGCGVDAWSIDWRLQDDGRLHNNWLHPPYACVGAVIRQLRQCRGRGTILVPLDTGHCWWPMVIQGAHGVRGSQRVNARPGLLLHQGTPCPRPPRTHLVAIKLDFSDDPPRAASL
jgi:hypothetical protein